VPSDYFKGHVQLLTQLTQTGAISAAAYEERLASMARCGDVFTLMVIEDTSRPSPPLPDGCGGAGVIPSCSSSEGHGHSNGNGCGQGLIVASATLLAEPKLVHSCGRAGHIEDVVVSADGYRGKQLGARLVQALHDVARHIGCYKIMLDCKETNAPFYAKLGYRASEVHMRVDL
jgi:glucosamine-phosphate N-acetyltransferase